MKNKKIKELWENKKELLKNKNAMMIGGITLVGLIALGSVGYMMATSNKEEVKIENKVVVSNKKNEKDIKESDNKSKEATNKKEDKVNKESSTENKVDTEEKKEVASDESKNSTSSNKQIEKNNTNSSSSNNNNEVNSVVGNTSQETAEKPSKPTNTDTDTNTNTHTHSWVEQFQIVNHQEQGHYEDVLVSAAWSEQIPVYKEQGYAECNGCKADITADPDAHMKENALAGNYSCGSWVGKYKDVQSGTETINHEAVYDKKYVVDKAAWSENIVSGYKCSCGATK